MIDSKKALKEYLREDKKALHHTGLFPKPWEHVWRFQRLLRRCEYYTNCRKDPLGKVIRMWLRLRLRLFGMKCGFCIPPNVFGKGLSIAHTGNIIINPSVRIGDYCRLHVGVNIGTAAGLADACPTIGNNVYIAPGAKIFGKITIADNVVIGANAVVNKDCLEPGVTLGGIPAKIISRKGSDGLLYAGDSGQE